MFLLYELSSVPLKNFKDFFCLATKGVAEIDGNAFGKPLSDSKAFKDTEVWD